jgi:hypothetical protein
MRARPSPHFVHLLIVFLLYSSITPIALAGEIVDTRNWKQKAIDGAASSATSIGVELAVKYATGLLHDTMCNPPAADDTSKFLCGVVGGLSGREEQAWKDAVTNALKEINAKLDTLTQGQEEIKHAVARIDTSLNYEFDNAAPRQKAFDILSNIDALWTTYTRLLKGPHARDRQELLDFANTIAFTEKLDSELNKLSTVIERPIMDAESVLRYPYVKWQKQNPNLHYYNFDPSKVYDAAEKKFLQLRLYQQRASLMYLFAAEVLESRCEMDPANCKKPPTSSKRFKTDFEQNMQDQLAHFNAALDWFVLAYSAPHFSDPGLSLPEKSLDTLTRANYLTMVLSNKKGLWGRIYSMGNKWDGRPTVSCGSSIIRNPAAFEYEVPVHDDSGSLDWWTSTANNGVYDEVRFAKNWRVLHYSADRPPGPCALQSVVPQVPGIIPWAQRDSEVIPVPAPNGQTIPFGSFLGVQRAGGGYAMVSGDWSGGHSQPYNETGGDATRKDIRFDWSIDKNHANGPQISLYHGGRGEWSGGDTKVYQYNIIHMWNRKKVRFPEDRALRLHMGQLADCAKVCRGNHGSDDMVMEYNIENASKDAGYLHALTGIYLHPDGGDSKATGYTSLRERMSNGVFINGSYEGAKDSVTKTKHVAGAQSGDLNVDPSKQYLLQYMIDYQLVTYTKGWNAVNFMYRTKLTPYAVYVTKR